MSRRYVTKAEHNAIIAGLRSLQGAHKNELELTLTDGEVEAIDDDGIDMLIEAIQFDEVQLTIEQED